MMIRSPDGFLKYAATIIRLDKLRALNGAIGTSLSSLEMQPIDYLRIGKLHLKSRKTI